MLNLFSFLFLFIFNGIILIYKKDVTCTPPCLSCSSNLVTKNTHYEYTDDISEGKKIYKTLLFFGDFVKFVLLWGQEVPTITKPLVISLNSNLIFPAYCICQGWPTSRLRLTGRSQACFKSITLVYLLIICPSEVVMPIAYPSTHDTWVIIFIVIFISNF